MSADRMSIIGNHQGMGMRNFYLTDIDRVKLVAMLWAVAGLVVLSFASWTSKTLEISFLKALELNIQVLSGVVCLVSFFVFCYENWDMVLQIVAPACIFLSFLGVWKGFYFETQTHLGFLDSSLVQWLGSYWALGLLVSALASVYAFLVYRWYNKR